MSSVFWFAVMPTRWLEVLIISLKLFSTFSFATRVSVISHLFRSIVSFQSFSYSVGLRFFVFLSICCSRRAEGFLCCSLVVLCCLKRGRYSPCPSKVSSGWLVPSLLAESKNKIRGNELDSGLHETRDSSSHADKMATLAPPPFSPQFIFIEQVNRILLRRRRETRALFTYKPNIYVI